MCFVLPHCSRTRDEDAATVLALSDQLASLRAEHTAAVAQLESDRAASEVTFAATKQAAAELLTRATSEAEARLAAAAAAERQVAAARAASAAEAAAAAEAVAAAEALMLRTREDSAAVAAMAGEARARQSQAAEAEAALGAREAAWAAAHAEAVAEVQRRIDRVEVEKRAMLIRQGRDRAFARIAASGSGNNNNGGTGGAESGGAVAFGAIGNNNNISSANEYVVDAGALITSMPPWAALDGVSAHAHDLQSGPVVVVGEPGTLLGARLSAAATVAAAAAANANKAAAAAMPSASIGESRIKVIENDDDDASTTTNAAGAKTASSSRSVAIPASSSKSSKGGRSKGSAAASKRRGGAGSKYAPSGNNSSEGECDSDCDMDCDRHIGLGSHGYAHGHSYGYIDRYGDTEDKDRLAEAAEAVLSGMRRTQALVTSALDRARAARARARASNSNSSGGAGYSDRARGTYMSPGGTYLSPGQGRAAVRIHDEAQSHSDVNSDSERGYDSGYNSGGDDDGDDGGNGPESENMQLVAKWLRLARGEADTGAVTASAADTNSRHRSNSRSGHNSDSDDHGHYSYNNSNKPRPAKSSYYKSGSTSHSECDEYDSGRSEHKNDYLHSRGGSRRNSNSNSNAANKQQQLYNNGYVFGSAGFGAVVGNARAASKYPESKYPGGASIEVLSDSSPPYSPVRNNSNSGGTEGAKRTSRETATKQQEQMQQPPYNAFAGMTGADGAFELRRIAQARNHLDVKPQAGAEGKPPLHPTSPRHYQGSTGGSNRNGSSRKHASSPRRNRRERESSDRERNPRVGTVTGEVVAARAAAKALRAPSSSDAAGYDALAVPDATNAGAGEGESEGNLSFLPSLATDTTSSSDMTVPLTAAANNHASSDSNRPNNAKGSNAHANLYGGSNNARLYDNYVIEEQTELQTLESSKSDVENKRALGGTKAADVKVNVSGGEDAGVDDSDTDNPSLMSQLRFTAQSGLSISEVPPTNTVNNNAHNKGAYGKMSASTVFSAAGASGFKPAASPRNSQTTSPNALKPTLATAAAGTTPPRTSSSAGSHGLSPPTQTQPAGANLDESRALSALEPLDASIDAAAAGFAAAQSAAGAGAASASAVIDAYLANLRSGNASANGNDNASAAEKREHERERGDKARPSKRNVVSPGGQSHLDTLESLSVGASSSSTSNEGGVTFDEAD